MFLCVWEQRCQNCARLQSHPIEFTSCLRGAKSSVKTTGGEDRTRSRCRVRALCPWALHRSPIRPERREATSPRAQDCNRPGWRAPPKWGIGRQSASDIVAGADMAAMRAVPTNRIQAHEVPCPEVMRGRSLSGGHMRSGVVSTCRPAQIDMRRRREMASLLAFAVQQAHMLVARADRAMAVGGYVPHDVQPQPTRSLYASGSARTTVRRAPSAFMTFAGHPPLSHHLGS